MSFLASLPATCVRGDTCCVMRDKQALEVLPRVGPPSVAWNFDTWSGEFGLVVVVK